MHLTLHTLESPVSLHRGPTETLFLLSSPHTIARELPARGARAELVSVQKAKAAADAACAAARSQTKVQARKRSQAAEAAGAELTRVADGLAASDRAAKTLAKRLSSLNASATGPVAVELRALARSLDASQRDAASARRRRRAR